MFLIKIKKDGANVIEIGGENVPTQIVKRQINYNDTILKTRFILSSPCFLNFLQTSLEKREKKK